MSDDNETALWRAVIEQALVDALSERKETTQVVARGQARVWFQKRNADFAEACALAGLGPDVVRDTALELIAKHDARLAAGEKMKARKRTESLPRRPRELAAVGA